MEHMIFHHPLPVTSEGRSGSQIRPYRMLQAFKALGYEVWEVTGHAAERKQAMARIKQRVSQGLDVAFCYSELSTMPTPLTEKHHIPLHPFLDPLFFRWLNRQTIPCGLFLRDIYWRFQLYRDAVPWFKRAITVPFYWYDVHWVRHTVDHIFVPSLSFDTYLSIQTYTKGFSTLHPGCDPPRLGVPGDHPPGGSGRSPRSRSKTIHMLYVGGVMPPLYDLTPLFEMLARSQPIHVTLCCREEEWVLAQSHYGDLIPGNRLRVVHRRGGAVQTLYEKADLFVLWRRHHEYLDLAMPVKLFESMGHRVPIVTLKGSGLELTRFIERESVGWVVPSSDALVSLVSAIQADPSMLEEKRRRMEANIGRHTWRERARQVAATLLKT